MDSFSAMSVLFHGLQVLGSGAGRDDGADHIPGGCLLCFIRSTNEGKRRVERMQYSFLPPSTHAFQKTQPEGKDCPNL